MKKLFILLFTSVLFAQNPVAVPTGTISSNPLNFKNNAGIFNTTLTNSAFEYVTTTAMNAITTPKIGREVFNTTTNSKWYYNGTNWVNTSNNWFLDGNTGTVQGNNFLGTTDNVGLSFRTNNTIRQTITNSGNVGIGTTTPTQLFEVNGVSKQKQIITYDNNANSSEAYNVLNYTRNSVYTGYVIINEYISSYRKYCKKYYNAISKYHA